MIENRNGKLPENHFLNHMNLIPSNSLKSICDDEILQENRFQKELLKPCKIRESEYNDKLHQLNSEIEDFNELTLIQEELNYCDDVVFEANSIGYRFTWYDSINTYKYFLEQKFLCLTKSDYGILMKYPKFNNQEVVFLYLWMYNNQIVNFKNESQLASYLESYCSSSSGNKISSAKSIISRIKSNDIDMTSFVNVIESAFLNFDFINW
jgi:hypothetical protein|tara:strand:+ start:68 stop:694 length:627 start_codon:yes stop_codon:yes gene_type:complete